MIATVLVVEDDPGMQQLLGNLLEPMGVNVIFTDTVSQALCEMLRIPPPDVIILDLGLPDSRPFETLDKVEVLRKLNPFAPITVLTGNADEKVRQTATAVGADAFRLKTDIKKQGDIWDLIKEGLANRRAHGMTLGEAATELYERLTKPLPDFTTQQSEAPPHAK